MSYSIQLTDVQYDKLIGILDRSSAYGREIERASRYWFNPAKDSDLHVGTTVKVISDSWTLKDWKGDEGVITRIDEIFPGEFSYAVCFTATRALNLFASDVAVIHTVRQYQ